MITVLRLLPAALCSLLLGAHFLRMGMLAPVIFACLLPFGLFWRRPFVRWFFVGILLLGSASWVLTTLQLIMGRQQVGAPFLRLGLILGGVAAFNLVAVTLLFGTRMRTYFGAASPRNLTGPGDNPADSST